MADCRLPFYESVVATWERLPARFTAQRTRTPAAHAPVHDPLRPANRSITVGMGIPSTFGKLSRE